MVNIETSRSNAVVARGRAPGATPFVRRCERGIMMGSSAGFHGAGSHIALTGIGSGRFGIAWSPRITWEWRMEESSKETGRAMGFGRECKYCPVGAAPSRLLTIAVTGLLLPLGGG